MIHAKKLILVERELLCFLLCLSVSRIPERLFGQRGCWGQWGVFWNGWQGHKRVFGEFWVYHLAIISLRGFWGVLGMLNCSMGVFWNGWQASKRVCEDWGVFRVVNFNGGGNCCVTHISSQKPWYHVDEMCVDMIWYGQLSFNELWHLCKHIKRLSDILHLASCHNDCAPENML